MKKITLLFLLISIICSCQENKKTEDPTENFEDSYKVQKESGTLEKNTEHFDSIKNIYSNYKYNVAFDAPDYWVSDNGVSDHTILRTFDQDSAIGISINVIETKFDPNKNIWEIYDANPEQTEKMFKQTITAQLNSQIREYSIQKTYIKNVSSIKRKFTHTIRDGEIEYDNVNIIQQVVKGNYYYTFSVFVPKMFYDENPDYYDKFFLNLYFLIDKGKTKNIINSNLKKGN